MVGRRSKVALNLSARSFCRSVCSVTISGATHRLEVVLLERLPRVFLDEFLNYLAADLFAEESFEQIARCMTGAKALEHDAAFEFVVGAIQLMLDFVGFDFNRKFAPETVGFFDIYIHGS